MKYNGPLYAKIAGKYLPLEAISKDVDDLVAERNELLSALEILADIYQKDMGFEYGDKTEVEEIDNARVIIAKAKERIVLL